MIGRTVEDHLPDGLAGSAHLVLGQYPDRCRIRGRHPTGIGDQIARQDTQQGGFAVAVAADDADHLACSDPETHLIEQDPSAEGVRDGFQIDQIYHVRKATSERRESHRRLLSHCGFLGDART